MRRRLLVGNWKLNKTVAEATAFAHSLAQGWPQALVGAGVEAQSAGGTGALPIDVAIAPPATALHTLYRPLRALGIALCAQDLYFEPAGAFTGALSAPLLFEAGARYTLVGHSERRALFHESVASTQLRLQAAIAAGLQPILCVGESLQEREAGKTMAAVGAQLDGALAGIEPSRLAKLILAYEPVWAIGTGKRASVEEAAEVHRGLRAQLASHHGDAFAAACRILYGGSVTPEGAGALLAAPNIDGTLVGGASLVAEIFLALVQASLGVSRG